MPDILADYSAGRVIKGRISRRRTGEFINFLLNPATIKDTKGSNLSIDAIPGFAHPQIQWASGKERVVSFKLDIDAEMSWRLRNGQVGNGADPTQTRRAGVDWNINGELDFYRSFEFPTEGKAGDADGSEVVIFTYGRRYRRLEFLMQHANIDITQFTPEGDPCRATVDIALFQHVTENEFSDHVWRNSGRNSGTDGL